LTFNILCITKHIVLGTTYQAEFCTLKQHAVNAHIKHISHRASISWRYWWRLWSQVILSSIKH